MWKQRRTQQKKHNNQNDYCNSSQSKKEDIRYMYPSSTTKQTYKIAPEKKIVSENKSFVNVTKEQPPQNQVATFLQVSIVFRIKSLSKETLKSFARV